MKNLVAGMALVVLVLLAVFVWPTRYRYESLKSGERTITMRTDRFSDKTWMLLPGGWIQQSKPTSKPMPEFLFTKLSRSTCGMNYMDDLSCDISNETDMAISSVMIEISWKDEKGKEPCLVEMKGSVSPHTMATLSEKPPCAKDMKQNTYNWRFVSVQAYQPQ
ncbi:MAG: hypothetical protein WCE53_18290 [Candidatus Acidiferrum sp.]